MARISPTMFKELRMRAGLSTTDLNKAGVSTPAVLAIEAGASQSMTLHAASVAVRAVGGRLVEVLEDDAEGASPPSPSPEVSDSALLETILFTAHKKLTFSGVEDLTGWKRPRVQAAIEALSRDLVGRGVTLSKNSPDDVAMLGELMAGFKSRIWSLHQELVC